MKKLYYINKKSEGNMMNIKVALESTDPEMSKRIRYSKDVLAGILVKFNGKNTKENSHKYGEINVKHV